MCNNQEHLEAYLAVPCMGAVLHTLNIRLFPEQLDLHRRTTPRTSVILVDAALVPLLAQRAAAADDRPARRRRPAAPTRRRSPAPRRRRCTRYDELLAAGRRRSTGPTVDERDAAAHLLHAAAPRATPRASSTAHRSIWLHSHAGLHGRGVRPAPSATGVLAVVPQFHAMAWGLPYAAFMSGASLLMPDRFLQAEPLARMIEAEQRRPSPAPCRRSGPTCCATSTQHRRRPLVAARGRRRRLGRARRR